MRSMEKLPTKPGVTSYRMLAKPASLNMGTAGNVELATASVGKGTFVTSSAGKMSVLKTGLPLFAALKLSVTSAGVMLPVVVVIASSVMLYESILGGVVKSAPVSSKKMSIVPVFGVAAVASLSKLTSAVAG